MDHEETIDFFTRSPAGVGETLKVIFEGNLGKTLAQVSLEAGIDPQKLQDIADDKSPLDRETALQLKKAFGDVAEVLYRIQFVHEYFQAHQKRPPYEEVYKISLD